MISQTLLEQVLKHLNLPYRWVDEDQLRIQKWLGGSIEITLADRDVSIEGRAGTLPLNQLGILYLLLGFIGGIVFEFWTSAVEWWEFLLFPMVTLFGIFQYFEERVVRRTVDDIRTYLNKVAPELAVVNKR